MARGSVVKRKSGNYAIVYYLPNGKQKWKTIGPSKKEAEVTLSQIMAEINRGEYQTIDDARARIGRFIEDIYNRKRLHSSIGYLPPAEFEDKLSTIEGVLT